MRDYIAKVFLRARILFVYRKFEKSTVENHSELRWALASEEMSRPFDLVGFRVNRDWHSFHYDLSQRLDYSRLPVLFSDGAPEIEDNFLSSRMDQQHCIWHGKRDFSFLLYRDKGKGKKQEPFLELFDQNPLFHLQKTDLEWR